MPIGVYHAYVGVVPCPCCGSTDLVLLGESEGGRGPMQTVDGALTVR